MTFCFVFIFLQAELVWNYCIKRFRCNTEATKNLDYGTTYSVQFGSSLSLQRTIEKAIADLPPKEKVTILECLRENNFPLQVLNAEQRILPDEFQNLLSGWAGFPRRYLRRKSGRRQVLQTSSETEPTSQFSPASESTDDLDYPAPFDLDYPSPLDIDNPSVEMKRYTPMSPQDGGTDNKMFLAGAVIASSMAGIALAALVLFLCVNKDRSDEEQRDVQRDDKPLLNFNGTDSPGNVFFFQNHGCDYHGDMFHSFIVVIKSFRFFRKSYSPHEYTKQSEFQESFDCWQFIGCLWYCSSYISSNRRTRGGMW